MMRKNHFLWRIGCRAAASVALAVGLAAPAIAQGLRYQDADELAIDPALGRPNVQPVEAFKSSLPVVDNDNLWQFRDFGVGAPNLPTVYQSGVSENSPMLTQTLTGLTPSQSYDLYAVYWTDEDENWTIRTGVDSASLTYYSWTGNGGGQPTAGSTPGVAASTAPWDVPPPPNKEPPTVPPAPPHPHPFIFIERIADPLVMLLGRAGTATANASGQIDVFVDDTANSGGGRRTWFDGVAFAPAGTAVAVTPTLDRATGALTLTNSTTQALQIKSYRIESQASGGLNAGTWNKVSTSDPAWMITAPAPPADPNAPFTTVIGESGTSNITLGANGGTINFGNVWNRSPFDHVLVYLTLANDQLAVLAPTYTGTAIMNGDLDGDGLINLVDFEALLNGLHTTPAATRVENYRRGDMTGDGPTNFNDFAAFRTAYDAANGAGAFDTLLAQVPEPASLVIVSLLGAAFCGASRRRARAPLALVLFCYIATGMPASALAVDIAIDLDSMRLSGTDTTGPIATQSGFTSWDLTNVGTEGTTTTVDGVTFEIFGLNAANQSRIRLTGTPPAPNGGGGALNDLLADFVFNEGADGRAIGLRVSGLPVGTHSVQSWHFDAGVGTPENTQVEIRNQGQAADPSQVLLTGVPWSQSPIEFLLEVRQPDEVKEIIFRESSAGNRARLSGFRLGVPVELTLEVNTETGAMRFVNQQGTNFDLGYYEIRSFAGSLNATGWSSLDDAEAGDPLGTGWDEAPASNMNILSEVNLQSMSSFGPGSSASLGSAFTVGGTEDVRFFYAPAGATSMRQGIVSYVTGPIGIPGDYNGDNRVDAADYVVWRKTDGSQTGYNTWRMNFGRTSGSGAALGSSAAVPEPGSLMLGALGLALMMAPFLRKSSRK